MPVPQSGFPSRYDGQEDEFRDNYGEADGVFAFDTRRDKEGYDPLLDELPETAIGEGVDIRGELQFDRLLRVDGTFEGKLDSNGSVVVGRKGCLIADVKGMDTLIIDGGKLIGDVQVDRLVLRSNALLQGNFSCKTLSIDQHCTVIGRSNVHSLAPEIIDEGGNVVILQQGVTAEAYYDDKRAKAFAVAAATAATSSLTVKGPLQSLPSSRISSLRAAPQAASEVLDPIKSVEEEEQEHEATVETYVQVAPDGTEFSSGLGTPKATPRLGPEPGTDPAVQVADNTAETRDEV